MFLKRLSRLRKTISFRLTFWYAAIFILSSVALFGLGYFLLSSSIEQQDQEMIQSKLREYAAQYKSGGIDALRKEVENEQRSSKAKPLFVRVADSRNKTKFLSLVEEWQELDLKQLEKTKIGGQLRAIHVKAKNADILDEEEEVLEIASNRLYDDSILQVGKSTVEREELLERFRNIFAGIFGLVILVGFSGGAFLALRALRPIRDLTNTVRTIIKSGEMETRVPSSKMNDEIEQLTNLLNLLLEKIEMLINGMRSSLDNVAHDLRTPMTRFRGTAEMALQSQQDVGVLREALTDCLEESERILTMLNTLMDISEVETGALRLHLERVNISNLVEEVVEMYRYVAEEKHIAIHDTLPGELYLAVDYNRIQQALANLLDNAIKYTPAGGSVDIEVIQSDHRVHINVKDTGVGIPPEEVEKIWHRLYRGDESRSQRGLGLGLSLVKAIVFAHHGCIDVTSEPGVGSTFTILLNNKF